MNKESILADLELLTKQQATTISIDVEGENGKTITVVKTTDGEGFQGDLSTLVNGFYSLEHQERQWVTINFYKAQVQSMGGRPDCP